jgi:lincosamide and streptogramin A transport system ATP-binding/permease protein
MMQRAKSTEKRIEREIAYKETLMKNAEAAHDLLLRPLAYEKDVLVSAVNLAVRRGGRPVSKEVTFEIRRGDRIAVTGANGSGKTSLLKLIGGQDLVYDGEHNRSAALKISAVSQDTSHLSGALKEYAADCGCDPTVFFAMLSKLGVSSALFDGALECLSSGQKKKVLLARSLSTQAHLYIWDEPLNFIDVMSRVQIERLIADCAPTMLFTEHDALFVARTATAVLPLHRRGLKDE